MAQQSDNTPNKGIFDVFSNKDEKAALEAARKELTALQAELAKVKAELGKKEEDYKEAQKRALSAEVKLNSANLQLHKFMSAAKEEQAAMAEQAKFMTEHTLTADETLSHLALQYYGHATEPYWRVIYEANKETMGDNPNRVRPGMVIKIPVLPAEMKK